MNYLITFLDLISGVGFAMAAYYTPANAQKAKILYCIAAVLMWFAAGVWFYKGIYS